ncbi:MAG: transglutaminase domain-containing protein [Bacteroidota bacterium]
MRTILVVLVVALFTNNAIAQKKYQGKPLILAGKRNLTIGIGQERYPERWGISPEIANDTLKVPLYGKTEVVVFKTDIDSIKFTVKGGESKSFYIKLGDTKPAHTIITAKPFVWDQVNYSNVEARKDLTIYYRNSKSTYFDSLSRKYPIAQLIKKGQSDMQKVLSILNWTHHQWKHDGNNAPKGNDAISILNEVKAGGRFPCFAYAIVLRDQLISQGFKARVLYLKTKDASTRKGSPGHVATEVFLNDQKKWVFIDGQFNVIPTLKGKPLNAVEFQKALSNTYNEVVLASRDKVSKRGYTEFVYDYLYYFDTSLDNRGLPATQNFKLEGKTSLMLVPVGAPHLEKIDFWNSKVNYCIYTNSIKDFYTEPK